MRQITNRRFINAGLQPLESRLVLTAAFVPHDIDTGESGIRGVSVAILADLDSDGDLDIVTVAEDPEHSIAERSKLTWLENDGGGSFGEPKIVGTGLNDIHSLSAIDFDGDQDVDLLFSDRRTDEIGWFENQGDAQFGNKQVIAIDEDLGLCTFDCNSAIEIKATDFDSDGDLDVLSSSTKNSTVGWYENQGDEEFGSLQILAQPEAGSGAFSFAHGNIADADFDGDGDMDILVTTKIDNQIVWYERNNGSSFVGHEIARSSVARFNDVLVADFDGDGDPDVVSSYLVPGTASESKLVWFENQGGGKFGEQTTIATDENAFYRYLDSVDFDRDGDLDLISTSSFFEFNQIAWHENNGQAGFQSPQIVSDAGIWASVVMAGDLNGDGHVDVVNTTRSNIRRDGVSPEIYWYSNDGTNQFSDPNLIIRTLAGPGLADSGDFDGDGDADIVTFSPLDRVIAWHENTGSGDFNLPIEVDPGFDNAQTIIATDLDGDGDTDILAANEKQVAWFSNQGAGSFTDRITISNQVVMRAFAATDFDGDGDLDFIMDRNVENIVWVENLGASQFSSPKPVFSGSSPIIYVNSADLNGDGKSDVISYAARQDTFTWYAQNDNGEFGDGMVIEHPQLDNPDTAYPADFDADGDTDLLIVSDYNLAWFENQGGDFSERHEVWAPSGFFRTISSEDAFYVGDVDDDGDIDITSSSQQGVVWFENDGAGNFSDQIVIESGVVGSSVHLRDIDRDGRTDIISSSINDNRLTWYEQRTLFDTNDDGRFDSSDLIKIFQAGEYEDNIANNSTFDEGDWNGDGDFDSTDLVLAFQVGTYSSEARKLSNIQAVVDLLFDDDRFDSSQPEIDAAESVE